MIDQDTVAIIADAFDRQADSFDEYEEGNRILLWMRSVIHKHMLSYVRRGDHLLELNAGTGIDAIFFAQNGVSVHAIDISRKMLERLKGKIRENGLSELVYAEQRSFRNLEGFRPHTFNHIFSDFGGLNCTSQPDFVIRQFRRLLKPGGTVTLVMMPPVCPWEILFALKGNFQLAFRRLQKHGTRSHVEGVIFRSYYFTPRRLIGFFGDEYSLLDLRGLGSLVPPPYLDRFPTRYPRLFELLSHLDVRLSKRFPFHSWADHFILTMRYEP
ncbi:MAG TPA: class I SAM-dependent methyltransferase [Candidatus Acidoferrales bacterium]|nr:class I SAM-dependent methyltransferase [Candidatus Acidoferrales bacterium]